jgi:serine phosphatase RsbU (regulator of sigma subunit)
MADPRPLRVGSISEHPTAEGVLPGVHTFLGVGVSSRRRTYGILCLLDQCDGKPFDEKDEIMIAALAGAAGFVIDDARLFGEMRSQAEEFQRLLVPRLPDLQPLEAAMLSRPAIAADRIGGDWSDAIRLPDDTFAVAIGDVGGHDVKAAAAMVQARSMLTAILYERHGSPSAALTQLDRTLQAITGIPLTTACAARLRPGGAGWRMDWSSAGHPAPLLLAPGHPGRYLDAAPGLPLGVDASADRPDHHYRLPAGATLIFFTDGLVEHPKYPIEEQLATLSRLAAKHADEPPERLSQALAHEHPSDGSDDTTILALRLPPRRPRDA